MKQVLHQIRDRLVFFPGRGRNCLLQTHLSMTNSRSKSQFDPITVTFQEALKESRQIYTITNNFNTFSYPYDNKCISSNKSYRLIVTNDHSKSSRPFKVLGLQQIAVGSLEEDKSSLRHLWIDILGIPKVDSFRSTMENVDEDILCLGPRSNIGIKKDESSSLSVEIDLMSPIDPNAKPKVCLNGTSLF